ncbi:MAG TPA: hypothetical protein VJM33_07755 [Microthrixaceae bacterium]|nr:hypothetical protein [Microthrixaceae bacterium]
MLHRLLRVVVLTTLFALLAGGTASAAPPFPKEIELPQGFRPEGIAIGKGTTFYVGSISTGAIYRGDLRTGRGAVITPSSEGSASIGLAIDRRQRLFVAGGPTGQGRVIDARTGEVLETYQFATGETFVNDVVVARGAAWFTDSFNAVLYRVPLDLGPATTVPLTGDLVFGEGFNVNGIEATANGRTLILVQTNTGKLFTADPRSGATDEIDLGGEAVPNGDGILLVGRRTLYVVQNQSNLVAVVRLSRDLAIGTVVDRLAPDGVDVPTTIDRFGSRLYVVNARFSTPPEPTTDYWITAVRRR